MSPPVYVKRRVRARRRQLKQFNLEASDVKRLEMEPIVLVQLHNAQCVVTCDATARPFHDSDDQQRATDTGCVARRYFSNSTRDVFSGLRSCA